MFSATPSNMCPYRYRKDAPSDESIGSMKTKAAVHGEEFMVCFRQKNQCVLVGGAKESRNPLI